MPRFSRFTASASVAAFVVVLLAGCSTGSSGQPSTPAATATVTATPPPTSAPSLTPAVAKSVTIDTDGLTVVSSSGATTVGYTDGAAKAISALESVFGAVSPVFLAAGKCNADQTTYDFGAVQLTHLGDDPKQAKTFTLAATKPATSVGLSTALGARVGGDFTSYVAGIPASQPRRTVNTSPRYDDVLESATAGSESSTAGIVVSATDGIISSISVPQDFNADC